MPVNSVAGPSKLKLTFSLGTDSDGKEIIKTKTFSGVKATATDEDVYGVADTLIGLQQSVSLGVGRIDEKEITQA